MANFCSKRTKDMRVIKARSVLKAHSAYGIWNMFSQKETLVK